MTGRATLPVNSLARLCLAIERESWKELVDHSLAFGRSARGEELFRFRPEPCVAMGTEEFNLCSGEFIRTDLCRSNRIQKRARSFGPSEQYRDYLRTEPRRQARPALYQLLANVRSGDPRAWTATVLLPLGALAQTSRGAFVNGPFGSDLLTTELQADGVPVIYIRDIREGEYRRVSKAFVSEKKARDLAVCAVRGGDVLIAKVGDPPGLAADGELLGDPAEGAGCAARAAQRPQRPDLASFCGRPTSAGTP